MVSAVRLCSGDSLKLLWCTCVYPQKLDGLEKLVPGLRYLILGSERYRVKALAVQWLTLIWSPSPTKEDVP